MTPFEKRMKESKERQSRILRLSRQTKDGKQKYTQAQIAAEIGCTKAYVNQIVLRARREARA
jgi:DNA-binding transcriptional regulator LsrR (DeoR family)